jgi:glycosyltransferase involved in cell wall biosynthesis
MRQAGISKGNVCIVSSQEFACPDYEVLQVPASLDGVSSSDLIQNYKVREGEFICKRGKKAAKDLRVAFVGNWAMECGLATYNSFLFPEIAKKVGDVKLFIERNDHPTKPLYQFGDTILPDDKLLSCWRRGEPLQELALAIKEYDPDVLLISHEYGLFSNARYWLSFLTQVVEFRTIVIFHSVFPHHIDKQIFEAGVREAVVHLQGAKDNLERDKGLNIRCHLIPHGCYPPGNQTKLWDNYRSKHSFITTGFGFPYKNFQDSIRATALLKEKYPDIFFTALFSESPFNKRGHQTYFNELSALIEKLSVEQNVGIVRGFQPDHIIDTYLRSNQVAVFPYLSQKGHEVFGSSGACRLAFSAGLPTITSTLAHFSDLPSIKADGAQEIAAALDRLFSNEGLKKQQIELQNQFIRENSWEKTAERYIEVFEQGD